MTIDQLRIALAAAVASAALAACSVADEAERKSAAEDSPQAAQPSDPSPAPSATMTPDSGDSAENGNATTGGDGSAIRLSPLGRDDVEAADLGGELACSFGNGEGETLLLARGDVASDEPAFGVVKVGDNVESVSARGGFDGMLRGATFVGRGKTVEIERTASKPVGGGESPPYPARLTYQRADGASRSVDGRWTCGP